jgi:hypothetical protein
VYTSNNFNKCANLDAFWADWDECIEKASVGGVTVYVFGIPCRCCLLTKLLLSIRLLQFVDVTLKWVYFVEMRLESFRYLPRSFHTGPHPGVGGSSGTMVGDFEDAVTSPNDPLFMFHHSNMDRNNRWWMHTAAAKSAIYYGYPARESSRAITIFVLAFCLSFLGCHPLSLPSTTPVARPSW